jgi:DNA-binding ferritin-like protein
MEIEIIRITPKSNTIEFADFLNKFLSKVKLIHWYTLNFNLHKILNDVYSDLSDSFDSFQEEIIGTSNSQNNQFPIIDVKNTQIFKDDLSMFNNDENMIIFYKNITSELKNILCSVELNNYISNSQSGLNNSKEEILNKINKSLYLISMIKI